MNLREKANIFETHLLEKFTFDGQVMCKLSLASADKKSYYDTPDNAYMTGMMIAAFSMKYAVTKDENDRKTVSKMLKAANCLCKISGKKGLLARSYTPLDNDFADNDGEWNITSDKKYRWRGDVSTDQMCGMFFGLYNAYKLVANEEEKEQIKNNLVDLMDHVLENGDLIIDIDGKRTLWGRYTEEYVTKVQPMIALLYLQHLKILHHVTGDKRYDDRYQECAINKHYAEISQLSWLPVPPKYSNHSDNVMIAMSFQPLLELEKSEVLLAHYKKGLEKFFLGFDDFDFSVPSGQKYYEYFHGEIIANDNPEDSVLSVDEVIKECNAFWEKGAEYQGVKPIGCPLYAYIAKNFLGLDETGVLTPSIKTLELMPFSMKFSKDTLNEYKLRFGIDEKTEETEVMEGKPIPINKRKKTWSAWVQNPYTTEGDCTVETGMEYSGHDFILGYWVGKYYGCL